MRSKLKGIIQLALSILVLVLFYFFYFKVLRMVGLNFKGFAYEVANFIRYLLVCLIVFVIYHGNVSSGKHKFNKAFLNSIIYCLACFIFLIVITFALHQLINYLGRNNGIKIGYAFTNYFTKRFTISFALHFVIEVIFIPFLLCIIFPLGFSNIIKNSISASTFSGLTFGVLYGISLNSSFEYALFNSITPAVIVFMLTYLYKNNHNIWSVIITYICYVLFGIFAINYIL